MKNYCHDCGNAQVSHSLEKVSNSIASAMDPLVTPFDTLWRRLEVLITPALSSRFFPKFFKLLHKLRLGRIAFAPDARTSGRARCFWKECEKRGIKVWEFQLFGTGRELFVAEHNGVSLTFDALPRPGTRKSNSIFWMDDKGKMREAFQKVGIPVARGGKYFWWTALKKDFQKLTPPVIIKPHQGSRSRHTTTHIENLLDLRTAFNKAKQLSPFVIMEEEHQGFVYRGTLIGGEVSGVLCREPACVIGDGISMISELLEKENQHPLRNDEIFHKIVLDEGARAELARQKLALSDIPALDKVVTFSQKSSRGLGGGITDVTDTIHPDNREILLKIAETLDDPLVGVDFMMPDVTRSWKEQKRCGVIECNSMPFIDLHLFPLRGQVRDTAGALCDLVFPESKGQIG